MIGAESEENCCGLTIEFFDSVQDAGGVVHRAEGIDRHGEAVLLEPTANLVGKAGAYEKQFLTRLYLETRFLYVYDGPKLHSYN